MTGGEHECLPDLTFLGLAVAHDGVGAVVLTVDLGSECHTYGGRNALTQRSGGHIHAGNVLHIGVSLEAGIRLTEG